MIEKRHEYLRIVAGIDPRRLVFLDESGVNASMTRSHAWVAKGGEFIERTPMNWGKNLTLIGAVRLTGWVVQSSMFASLNKELFVRWMRRSLLPKLRRGDVVVMDNLRAHKDERVATACTERGVRVLYLPPYSPDLSPIEPGWALQKQFVRKHGPRTSIALRRIAARARFRVSPLHCRRWFEHCGYAIN